MTDATFFFFFCRLNGCACEIAALTLFVTVLALVYAVVMLYNFNKGLKEASKLSPPVFL